MVKLSRKFAKKKIIKLIILNTHEMQIKQTLFFFFFYRASETLKRSKTPKKIQSCINISVSANRLSGKNKMWKQDKQVLVVSLES